MTVDARGAIDALRRSHAELVALVEPMDADVLARPSACSEWTVAQVLSHLGSAAEIGLAALESGSNDMDRAQAVWGRWNAMAPADQATGLLSADERYVAAYEQLDDDALATKTVDLGFLPEPAGMELLASMRLSEVGLHRWDVEVGSQPAAAVPAYLLPFALDVLQRFSVLFGPPSGRTGEVAVRTTDPDGAYLLTLAETGVTLVERDADAPTRLRLPADALARLLAGRLAPEHTPSTVTIEGELTLDDLRACFPGY